MTTQLLESDVVAARGGDEAAFRRLVEKSANTVCSIALAIVRNVQASEDVAQEVFLAAWSNLRTLRNPASFLPWLRQVTRNQAHLWRREHARETSDEAMLAATADSRPSPADRVLADEESRVLREVLDQLPDDAREVLVLYYREESSTKQVASLLGISEPAVRQRLARSRALVREELRQRFAATVTRTAPGAAFLAAVGAAMTLSAPIASAAIAATTASFAKATLVGGVLGWAGVLMGMRALEPPFDEREARQLRWFRNVVLLVVTIGCAAVAMSTTSAMRVLVTVQSLYAIVGALYLFWLPRILRRRAESKDERRRWMRATVGRAAAAAIAGLFVMALIVTF